MSYGQTLVLSTLINSVSFSFNSSCREGCRRAFRGILHIPGCKTLCFKCVLLPCYSNTDSDDEKEKDDEGYDSYGNTETHAHPNPEDGHDTSGSMGQVTQHDYVNSVQYTNIEIAEIAQAHSSDNVYVPMQLESLDHLTATRGASSGDKELFADTELLTCKLRVECPNPSTSYVNVPESSPLLKRTGDRVSEKDSSLTRKVGGGVESEEVAESQSCVSKQHSKMAENQGATDHNALELPYVDGAGTRAEDRPLGVTSPPSASTAVEEIDGPSGKKMVLLETDL